MDSQKVGQVSIPISKNSKKYAGLYTALVSEVDSDLAQYDWNASVKTTPFSVYAIHNKREDGCPVGSLHRIILARKLVRELLVSEFVDHINRNPLDCTRENLRLATRSQNGANRTKPKTHKQGQASSIYKGVFFLKTTGKWTSSANINRKRVNFGRFNTELDAHRAYCEAVFKHFGDFANFGDNSPFTPDMFMSEEKAA